MKEAESSANSLQVLSCDWPWKEHKAEANSADGFGRFATLPTLPAWRILFQRFRVGKQFPKRLPRGSRGLVAQGRAQLSSLVGGRVPEEEFGPDAAESAVQNVQRDLDELYQTRRSKAQGYQGTLALLAALSVACLLVPAFLAGSAEVLLPIAGAGLTLFTAAEESQAMGQAAASKLRAAELNSVVSTMEVLLSASAPYRARLTAATGLTAVGALAALILEHPAAHGAIDPGALVLLIALQAGTAAWCVWPLQAVWHWTDRVRRVTSSFADRPLEAMGLGRDSAAYGGPGFGSEPIVLPPRRRIWPLLFALPAALPLWLLPGRTFAQRAVASTAAGAGVVAVALFAAELAASRAERMVATRASTFALTDAFANEGMQQSAILPLVSATSLALSALIAFLVEFNPLSASALTLLQTVTWVLAARKGVAAKYYGRGALQVDSVTERSVMAR